jgi:uncharacterized membrane protein YcfT
MGNYLNTSAPSRMEWMDILRGVAIILVAFNHGVLFTTLNSEHTARWLTVVTEIVGPVRMPLLVLLSGMLLPQSVAKGWHRFSDGKLRGVLYPYVLWSVLVFLIDSALRVAQGDPDFINPLDAFFRPYAHLWFLYYLFIYFMIGFFVARLPSLAVATAGVVLALVLPDEFQRFCVLLTFFFVGRWIREKESLVIPLMAYRTTGWVTGSIAIVLLSFFAVTGTEVRYEAMSIPLVIVAVVFCIWLSIRFQNLPGTRILKFIGRKSLVFYLVHWFPVLIGVEVGMAVAPASGWISVAIATAFGVGSGFVAAWVTDRFSMARLLFQLPPRSLPRVRGVDGNKPSADPR